VRCSEFELSEIAGVLVRVDDIARIVEKPNHGVM
jgi:hypothetical protein